MLSFKSMGSLSLFLILRDSTDEEFEVKVSVLKVVCIVVNPESTKLHLLCNCIGRLVETFVLEISLPQQRKVSCVIKNTYILAEYL